MKNQLIISVIAILTVFGCQTKDVAPNAALDLWLDYKGAQMPIRIEGNRDSKIFLLVLHGGPGGSGQSYNLYTPYFSDLLEEKYAVAYWDQRQSGASKGDHTEANQTVEQFVEDTDKVIDLLRFKFGKDIKVFLVGHSWGGYLSMAYSAKHQQNIKAQIIINGLTVQNQNPMELRQTREIAQMQIAKKQQEAEWQAILDDLKPLDSLQSLTNYSLVRGNALKAESIITQTLVKSTCPDCKHIFNWDNEAQKMFPYNGLKNVYLVIDQANYPLNTQMKTVTLPTGFIVSDYDVRVSKYVADFAYRTISTPLSKKGIITIKNAAHSPMNTHPKETAEAVISFVERWK